MLETKVNSGNCSGFYLGKDPYHFVKYSPLVKSKVGQLYEYSPTSYKAKLQLVPHKVRELAISYLRHYKSDFDTVIRKVGLLYEYI